MAALSDWERTLQSASKNRQQFKFQLTNELQFADIVIKITDRSSGKVLGVTDVTTFLGNIVSARITLITTFKFSQLSHIDLTNVARHEIGHALELGHTEGPKANDLMNPTYDSMTVGTEL